MECRRVMWLLVNILYYMGQLCGGKVADETYLKAKELHNHKSAGAFCEQKQFSKLPSIRTISDHRTLTLFLRKHEIRETWLDSSRQRFAQYQWVDGSDVDPAISRMGQQVGYSCGVLDLALGAFDFRPCSEHGFSYLCQINDCEHCTDVGMTPSNCITIGNVCYIYNCGVVNWWGAEVKCRNFNGTLAILKDEKSIKDFRSFWDNRFLGPCSNSWIGIQHETWTHSGHSSVALWARDEPQDGKHCLILSKERDDYLWRSASCEESCEFVCHKREAIEETTTAVLMSRSSISHGNPTIPFMLTGKRDEVEDLNRQNLVLLLSAATLGLGIIIILIQLCFTYEARRIARFLRGLPEEEQTEFLKLLDNLKAVRTG